MEDLYLQAADKAKLTASEALAAIDVVIHGAHPIAAGNGAGLPVFRVLQVAKRFRKALKKIQDATCSAISK